MFFLGNAASFGPTPSASKARAALWCSPPHHLSGFQSFLLSVMILETNFGCVVLAGLQGRDPRGSWSKSYTYIIPYSNGFHCSKDLTPYTATHYFFWQLFWIRDPPHTQPSTSSPSIRVLLFFKHSPRWNWNVSSSDNWSIDWLDNEWKEEPPISSDNLRMNQVVRTSLVYFPVPPSLRQ